jgi:phosphoribulokinase
VFIIIVIFNVLYIGLEHRVLITVQHNTEIHVCIQVVFIINLSWSQASERYLMALLIPSRQIVLFDYVRGAADSSRNAPTEA